MKQSFIKRMSLLAVLLVMTLGAFAQVGNSLALLTSTNTSPIEHQTTQTRADVLYNNDVPTTTSGLISVYWAGSDALVQIADDFIGGEGWIIEKVVTSGFCNANPIPTVYGIVFYTDDNGKPGTELYKNITCQGVVVGSDIEITLPTAYTLPSTGKFWISIYGVRTQVQDFNWRFDIYTSTTAVGSPLYLKDHKNVFGSGTEWMPVSPGLISGVVSMKFSLYGTRPTILIPVPGELFAIEEEANAAHLIWEPLVSENLTGYEVRRKLVSETDWDLADVIATSLPAAQKEYMDYTWGAADYGVYHWAVIASYSDIADARLVSNTLDKDMITEVDVTVTLNSGESAAGVEVTFTNTSEPDLDLVYQTSLPATGKFSWDEFRKGTYDVVVKYPGFTMITETDELIVEETSFIWLMEEKLTEAIDLYVTPTAFASWSAPVFTPFHETFDNGLPSTWTVENNGNKPAGAWTALTQYSYYGTNYSLNSTPFVMADSDAAGYGSVCDELLISPVMNVSMCDELFLSFIQYYRHLGATAFSKVQVFDGNEWVTVLNQTATVGSWASPNVQEINVTEYINSAFQVRFHYTGNWAYYWAIDDVMITAVPTKDRSLVQYKVYLNDVFVTNTTETSYQFDVANLTVGQSYVAEVMADYTTGQAERVSYEFTYLGCDAYDALTALAVTQPVGTKNAALTWTNPDLTDVDFLRVYRNGDLYRDNLSMDTPFSTWTDVTLDNGTYNYALTLVYDDGAETCLDAATTSITIKSTGTINGTVTYALGGNVQGATITVSNTDNTYTFTTAAAGTYTGTVEAGTYEVKCEFAGHVSQTTNATIAYVGTTSIDFSIYETPVAVDNVLAWVENGAVTVSWDGSGPPQGENIVEDVESHTAFTVNSPGTIGWSYIDGDGNPTYGFSGISFPGSAGAMAFIVFDPKLTSPEMYTTTPGIHAHSGDKFFGSFAANPAPNNDWIVSPELSSPTKISFWAKTYMPDYGLERMKVGYSTTGTAQSDFTFVTGSSYVSVPSDAWTFYEYDLPANAKYAAINCVSNDAFIFMVDDITIELAAGKSINLSANNYNPTVKSDALIPEVAQRGKLGQKYEQVSVPSTPAKGTRALAGYEVYRNDCYEGEAELLASLPATAGTFTDNQWSGLEHGVYKWGVKAIYDLNASEMVYSNCIDKDMITEVSVKVTLNTAENPEGTKVIFTNTSEPAMELVYEIELDETGYFLFEEFRKGEYDITVNKTGYAPLELTEESIWEATDYVWVLDELTDPVLDLYVSPTGYATWGSAAAAFEGFYENFDAGMPETWTIVNNGSATAKWQVVSNYSGNSLNGTPFAMSDSDATLLGSADETLTSPIIDASMCDELYLNFIQYYYHLGASAFTRVEVYNGTEWVTVLNQTASVGSWAAPVATEIDVTEHVNENFQIRFYYKAGWAYYWSIDDVMLSETPAKDRAVQSYKIWLDGVFAADVVTPYYQHDVTGLVEDQEYTTEVAVVYTSGMSEKASYTWTYKPCEYYGGALTFEAEVTGNQEVTLNWTLPEGTTPPPPPEDIARIELVANNVWGDGSGYIMMLDADANMYPEMPSGNFGGTMSAAFFNEFEYTIPEGATTAISSPVVATGSAYIDIPAGTYDYIIVNPESASGVVWVAGSAGPASTTGDNYSFEAGKKYTFTMSMFGSNDGATLVITDISKATTNLQPIKPIIASTGEKSYSYGSEIRTTENVSVIDRSKLQSEISPSFGSNGVASRAQWDLVKEFNLNAGGEQGIATDGEYIYTAFWGTAGKFSKYEMDGTYIEDFTISGGGATRDITYDGEYFYGSAGSTTIYKYDFANKTLIGTISSAKTARHISYDPETGGFYVGDWSDLSLISSTGSLVSTCPAPSSAYGSAYYAPSDGSGPYLFLNTQDGGYGTANVYTYDISSNTMSTTYVNVAASMTGIDPAAAIAGGAFIADYDGKLCFFANIQQTPNKVGIFELEEGIIIPPPPIEPILGVNIYRDGELLAFVKESITEYVDKDVAYGEHEYCIRVVYESLAMSCDGQCEPVMIDYPCDPTGNLEGVNPQNTQNALISWGAEPIEEWLYYDDGVNEDAIGGPASFIWAIKFDPSQLTHLEGTSLTKIMTYKYAAGTDELRIYQGTNAATLLHSQPLDGLVVGLYEEVELSSAVAIDVTQQLWIGIATTNGANWPAATSSYMGNPNSAQISQDGGASWANVNDLGVSGTWMLRGFVTNARGVEMAIPMEKPIDPISTESFVARGKGHYNEAPVMVTRSNDALQGYNVYRKLSTESTYTVVGNVPAVSGQMSYEFLDADLAQGTYHFQVRALYEFEDGYECESEPALTPDGSQNFVEVIIGTGIDGYGAEARIYPNPASNYITIEAAKMNRITVMSMVGQVVYDVKVDSNQESVDVSSLKSGVYVVRISTESGVSTERITIVR